MEAADVPYLHLQYTMKTQTISPHSPPPQLAYLPRAVSRYMMASVYHVLFDV